MDPRQVYLHIGCAKTGTTSLQWSLKVNREILMGQGVLYPLAGLSDSAHEFAHHRLVSAARVKDEALWNELAGEIAAHPGKRIVISSENFSLLDNESIRFVGDRLAAYSVTVVAYLRDQVDFAEALYNQAVKTGAETRTRDEFVRSFIGSGRGNYLRLLESWKANTNAVGFIVRIYQKTGEKSKDVIDDFAEQLRLDAGSLKRPPGRLNEGVGNTYLEFLRHVNSLGISLEDKNEKIVGAILQIGSRSKKTNRPIFSSQQRWMIRNVHKAINQQLVRRFFPEMRGDKSLFAIGDSPQVEAEPEEITSEALASILAAVLLRLK